ncbi:MAG: hypothetical protein KTR13_05975 [Saprospiraceae bacterium]|nr:hypothetical protein [Saprospiraceae bacterium]
MTEHQLKKYDVLSKIGLGIVGLLITLFLGITQRTIQKNQQVASTSNQIEQRKFQILNIVNDNLSFYSSPDQQGEIARAIINSSAAKLSEEYNFPDLAEILNRAIQSDSTLQETISGNQRLILQESSAGIDQTNQWYCVIGTFELNQLSAAKALQNRVGQNAVLREKNISANIYKTAVSRKYAVTLEGWLTKAEAVEFVQIARASGIADDAFYQINRDWTKVD